MTNTERRKFRVLWADDVRQEEGGKLSVMGIYSAILEVPGGTTLPRIFAFAEISSPVSEPFESIRFVAKANDNVVLDVTLPPGSFTGMKDQITRLNNEEKLVDPAITLRVGLPFFGLTVNEQTVMRLTVETEQGVMAGEALLIRPQV